MIQLVRIACTVASILFVTAAAAAQSVAPNRPVAVRILYDGSGSMYPGYTPPGTGERRTKADLGVQYFHEYPRFREWLADLAGAQTLVGGGSIDMWTFTSHGAFTPGDVQEVHPRVPPGQFDISRALRNFPERRGQSTYLTEAIDAATREFSGLLWLVTDNIVETTAGQPDAEVERFFRMLNDEPRFRSVHLFKYPFRDEAAGAESALAVYAIVVSAAELPASTLSHYDRLLRTSVRSAAGRGGPLFPGQEHLKLKDLRVDPMELRASPTLTLLLDEAERGMFKEGQRVQLGLTGDIKSNLTQHSVTAGRYDLSVASPFVPEEWASRDLGVEALPPQGFASGGGSIGEPIPPNGARQVRATLQTDQPVSFTPKSLGAWLRLAWNGAVVKYTGTVRMSFNDVNVRLERARMAGIFGIDRASAIFDFQDVRTLEQVNPSDAQVSFALRTGASRTGILLALLLLIVALFAAVAAFGLRTEWYRIAISGTPDRVIPLRRLGRYSIVHEGHALGHLTRDLLGGYAFAPNTGTAAFQVKPATEADVWEVRFREGRGVQLSIVPRSGKRSKVKTPKATASRPAARPSPPPRALPKIDRP